VVEALETPINTVSTTDILLYVVDLYDVILSVESSALPLPSKTQIVELREKATLCFLKNYDRLYVQTPGRLLGWTHGMLLYVTILMLIKMQYKCSPYAALSPSVLTFIKRYRLRMFEDIDPSQWLFSDLVSMLDVVAFRWNTFLPCKDLETLLEVLWRVSSKFITEMHTKDRLNITNFCDPVKGLKHHVRVSEVGIILSMSRFFWFKRLIIEYNRWPMSRTSTYPSETNFETFIQGETKSFITRRFRDNIAKFIWPLLLKHGDMEIGSHDQLGETVSAFTIIFQRFPAGWVNNMQKILNYAEYEEIIQNKNIAEYVHICMIHQFFMSTYNVNWITYFLVFERAQYKHIDAIERSVVPIILHRSGRFVVFFEGTLYENPDGCGIEHAFIVWLCVLRERCDGRCFDSMDFTSIIEKILDKDEQVDNTRVIDGFFDLNDEV
jgi:hypothetical protein